MSMSRGQRGEPIGSGGQAGRRVRQIRAALSAVILVRVLSVAGMAGLGAWILSLLVWAWAGASGDSGFPLLAALVAATATALASSRRAGGLWFTPQRVALWIEEGDRSLRWSLVTALEGVAATPEIERAIRSHDLAAPLRAAARRVLWWPLALIVTWAGTVLFGRTVVPSVRQVAAVRAAARPGAGPAGELEIVVRVTPPAYAGQAEREWRNPSVVSGLAGSIVHIRPLAAGSLRLASDSGLEPLPAPPGAVALRLGRDALGVRLTGTDGRSRILALDPVPDSAPVVALLRPLRDAVLRDSAASISLGAALHDDLGLRRAAFEYIVSSGEGETFSFASGVLGAAGVGGVRWDSLEAWLDLGALRVRPGDVVHVRAVAWDGRDDTASARGVSETRTVRVARRGELDSVAVEASAPAEADQSLLSQRMLVNLAEALVKRRRAIAPAVFAEESRQIALDQGRLRRQVAEIVFARLGDDPTGEHFHGDGHEHEKQELRPALTPDELLRAAENATRGSAGEALDLHDETPVVAVNRPLLEAYNAMWDAGRELEQISPERALPHMYRALDGIQRARNAERLYLRSRPPRAVVDVERVRLLGQEAGSPGARTPRPLASGVREDDLERFRRAVALVALQGPAAADSLLLLRVAVLDRHPAAAAALGAAAAALRAGRDVTSALIRARQALEGGVVRSDTLARWSRVP